MKILTAEFIKSAPDIRRATDMGELPEFVLLGRSNVGKSSFINSVLSRKNLAKTSNTPGKTRLINFYKINDAWLFVDLPGYGYAKVSKTEQQRWQKDLEEYLRERDTIKSAILLFDARLGPQKSDLQMREWLEYHNIPCQLVMTKVDKLSKNEISKQHRLSAQQLGIPPEEVLSFSATTLLGLKDVHERLRHLLSQ